VIGKRVIKREKRRRRTRKMAGVRSEMKRSRRRSGTGVDEQEK